MQRLVLILLFVAGVRGQDPLRTLPHNYRLVYENDSVRVIDVVYQAHEKLPVHNHSDKPTVYVYLTDSGPVLFSHVEEHSFSLLRPPEKAGTFRVSPGRLERHAVENVGEIATEFLRVELKQVPLGFQGQSFRSSKSFDLTNSGVSTEFPGPFVKIQRVVAAGQETTEIKEPDSPALLIAISPASLRMADSAGDAQTLNRGQVCWMKPNQECRVASASRRTPGHLLQIIFLPGR